MTRIATILGLALTTALVAASSAVARGTHATQASDSGHDTVAMVGIAVLGLLIAASALVPLGRRRETAARA